MTSLNPVHTVGAQIAEAVRIHQGLGRDDAMARATEMLRLVRIPDAERRLHSYPHEFSGGMRQRVMIAMALSCQPKLLIADEPTTALDVTIQAQILELIKGLRERVGTSVLLITHDLGVVAGMADEILVMYAGKVAEFSDARGLFHRPAHPYTEGLLRSIPRLDAREGDRLVPIRGLPPIVSKLPPGCPFRPRCDFAVDACGQVYPARRAFGEGHFAHCHNPRQVEGPA
jgi:oligopeptide/dipeptide ABC transporter ATP-binding protein